MNTAISQIKKAAAPEDVFGVLEGLDKDAQHASVKEIFHKLSFQLHPDLPGHGKAEADAMAQLTELRRRADEKIAAGHYGQPDKVAAIIRAGHVYTDVVVYAAGDISDIYTGKYVDKDGSTKKVIIKLARVPTDRDLMDNEVKTLKKLLDSADEGKEHFRHYLPKLVERTNILIDKVNRPALVLKLHENTLTAKRVSSLLPNGLDPRDAAWMWRRLLEVLAWTHQHNIVHGAVLPDHLLLRPTDHGAKLIDWSYSVSVGQKLRAMVPALEAHYPAEVRRKEPATPALDVFMAAKLAVMLHGGDVETNTLPDNVPSPIVSLLRACLIQNPHRRYPSAMEVYGEYDKILKKLYGPPAFRELVLPTTP